MTGPNPTPDPFRALDGAEPAADWEAVVARADAAEPLALAPAGGRRSRRPLLVAAALVLVAGAVGGAVVAGRDDGGPPNRQITAEAGEAAGPEAIWGRTWRVTRFLEDGRQVPHTVDAEATPIILDLGIEQTVRFEVFNSNGGTAVLRGDRLRSLGLGGTLMACVGQRGEVEARVFSLLRADPTVAVDGDRLTLRTDRFVVDLVDASADHRPSRPDPKVPRDPAQLWGRIWDLMGIEVDGERREPLPPSPGATAADPWVQLDATGGDGGPEAVDLLLRGCNIHGGRGSLAGDRLDWQRGASTQVGCPGDQQAQDDLLTDALADHPQVVVAGSEMYLVTDAVVLTFLTRDDLGTPATAEPATTTSSPSPTTTAVPATTAVPTTAAPVATDPSADTGGGACTFTFGQAPTGDPADRFSLDDFALGQADPPLISVAGQPSPPDVQHGTFSGDRVAEISVPGIVVDDLTGDRTEDFVVDRDGGIDATLWFRGDGGVQARVFAAAAGPCGSYTVTVAGGTEQANRALAVRLADQVVPAER